MSNEQTKDRQMAVEVAKILPETNDKLEHYKEVLRAESDLLNNLQDLQGKFYVGTNKKKREKLEIVNLKNSILQKQKIYENYLARKNRYEKWLDEKSLEVNTNFDSILEEAKGIKSNVRLVNALNEYEQREEKPKMQEKVEFYLYLKQEIENHKKHGKKKLSRT